jgi:hypothetical protein
MYVGIFVWLCVPNLKISMLAISLDVPEDNMINSLRADKSFGKHASTYQPIFHFF